MRYWTLALLLVAGLALASCGESDEEKALNQVCDARAEIQKQVNELSSLTPTTATVDGVKGNLSAIGDDLKEIKDAQGKLNDQRKEEVQAANQAFSEQVQAVVKDLGTSTSISGAQSQLQSSLQQLSQSYKQTFAPIDCS
jgi:uncharacterized phage infection (PIP) family protein YhgE